MTLIPVGADEISLDELNPSTLEKLKQLVQGKGDAREIERTCFCLENLGY